MNGVERAIAYFVFFFFFQAEDGIRDYKVTGVQTCALPIAPTYRSNLFIIMLQNETSKEALRLVKQRNKEDYAWSLSYRLYTADPFPPRITLNENVNRVEIAVDSLQLIKDHHKLTHEAMINPFSSKAASLPPLAEPTKKRIPLPRYAP